MLQSSLTVNWIKKKGGVSNGWNTIDYSPLQWELEWLSECKAAEKTKKK